jgi:Zn finger protein HypA/HybF involved in hydrogenase expression
VSVEIVLQIATLAGGGALYIFNAWKEARDRQWRLEDEARKAAEARAEQREAAERLRIDLAAAEQKARLQQIEDRKHLIETLVRSVRREATREGRVTRRTVKKVHLDLGKNTAVNADALSAANHVNLKLATLTHALREALASTDPKTAAELEAIETIVSDLDAMKERLSVPELHPVAVPEEEEVCL